MEERMLCLVWCEDCCNRHWDVVNHLGEAGRVVSKSGTLKVAVRCESCRNDLAAGDEATACTFDGGTGYAAWEGEDLGPKSGGMSGDFQGGGMGQGMTCLILCDECCGEHWEEASTWIHQGRAASKSGRLKVAVECRGCGVLLLPGESVEAVTLHGGGESHFPWEDEYIGPGWEEVADGDGRTGRVQ